LVPVLPVPFSKVDSKKFRKRTLLGNSERDTVIMDQDWTPVTLTKTQKTKTSNMTAAELQKAKLTGHVHTERKVGATATATGASARKIEESSEDFKVPKVDVTLSKAITQARMAKKMTQQQLATEINESAKVIQEYESGKAIPNPQILNKLDRVLGIHLPRVKK